MLGFCQIRAMMPQTAEPVKNATLDQNAKPLARARAPKMMVLVAIHSNGLVFMYERRAIYVLRRRAFPGRLSF